ncbi:MAG: RagB/SusD family nutrient uptake outer membrane protein [Longimicrobiales bacterium]
MAVLAVLTPALTACDSFFEVINPNVIESSTVDPVADGTMFSRSAFQTFAAAYGLGYIVYTAWFTNELWVGDTFPTRNEYGRRFIDDRNTSTNGDLWFPLTRSIAQSEQVMEVLGDAAGTELNVARAAFTSAYALTLQAEAFCEGTMVQPGGVPGGKMTPAQLLEAALVRFDKAIAKGGATTGTEATNIVTAARVGKGRALLNLGRKAEAAAAVNGVATSFTYNIPYVDDASNRARLGNGVYYYSFGGLRESLVVSPEYRAMNDPRIQWNDAGKFSQDGELRLWNQKKYPAWNSPIRLASGLEARYIEAEANVSGALAFINERRAVGGQAALSTTNATELLAALMAQKSRDFWIEGMRMGDWRRNGSAVPNILQPGANYYKPALGDVQNQTCMPLPYAEYNANPNM